ncbi:MAG: hypothetical protein WC469_00680 [Candidatus Omnitrophota bacterium]
MKIRTFALLFIFLTSGWTMARAKEFNILYTGGTHAMLYPCNCPIEPDGGIARRGSLIKELRKKNPNTLLLDSGDFFAGGLQDEYTQNSGLDMQRTTIELEAMVIMGYDAVGVAGEEFNFTKDFLEKSIKEAKFTFLSANIKSPLMRPYVLKEIDGVKFGITSVISPSVLTKVGGLELSEPGESLGKVLARMKKEGVDIVVLLSRMDEARDMNLIKEVPGIDVIIDGQGRGKDDIFLKSGPTLIVKTSWQGRHLGRLMLDIDASKKIVNYKAELLRLSDEIPDEPAITAILPQCFSDANCKKGSVRGSCNNPGTPKARCAFARSATIRSLVITSKGCAVCDAEKVIGYLKKEFPGLSVSYLYYGSRKADRLIADFGIKGLPAYLLEKEIEKEPNFSKLADKAVLKGDYYVLEPNFSGLAYLLGRRKQKGNIDVFLSLYDASAVGILENVRQYQPALHFLVTEQGSDFSALKGKPEVEESLRSVCVQKYYPKRYWDYLVCRAANISSSWWQECASGIDVSKIAACARGQEGEALLRDNIRLNKELEIMFGPLYLIDNNEIFGIRGVPSKEEFRRIFKK